MLNFLKGRSFDGALAAVGIAYPFLIYFGLHIVSPSILVTGLLCILALKFVFHCKGQLRQLFAPVSWFAAGGVLLVVVISPVAGLKAYPVLMSLGWATLFGYSLIWPPTIIERIARLREPALPPSAIPYLRNVTLVWLGFLLVNAVFSTVTAICDDLDLWTLYNGLVSYIVMGALFAGEFVVRWFIRRRQRVPI
jgi:uncharacterized membrane protein